MNKDYEIRLDLRNGVHLRMLFYDDEHKWIFNHRMILKEEGDRFRKPALVCDTRLYVGYIEGVSQDCDLSFSVERPDKRGKISFAGMNISPGAHLELEIKYEKQEGSYRAVEVTRGANDVLKVDGLAGLVSPNNLPIPLLGTIEKEDGIYKIHFLREINK